MRPGAGCSLIEAGPAAAKDDLKDLKDLWPAGPPDQGLVLAEPACLALVMILPCLSLWIAVEPPRRHAS